MSPTSDARVASGHSLGTISSSSGCSGASTMYVAPNSVSGRVVNTSISMPSCPSTGNTTVGADAAPDPVALHRLDRLRPVEQVEVGEQPVGVRGDLQLPLLQGAAEHRMVAAVAAPVGGDFLVGQHGAERGAPVDDRLVEIRKPVRIDHRGARRRVEIEPRQLVGVGVALGRTRAGLELFGELGDRTGTALVDVEPRVEDLQEDPLRPPVVADIGGVDPPPGIVGEAEGTELAAHGGDVRVDRGAWVLPVLHRELLGGQAERVVAHGVEHVAVVHAHEPRVHVGADVAHRVADVQPLTARVGEHVEHVELVLARHAGLDSSLSGPGGVGCPERVVALPAVLPLGLDLVREARAVAVLRRVARGGRRVGHGRRAYRACFSATSEKHRKGRWYPEPLWGCSSVGRAPPWHGGSRRFESDQLHARTTRSHSADPSGHA